MAVRGRLDWKGSAQTENKGHAQLTVSVWVVDNTTHAHLRSAFEQTIGDETVSLCNAFKRTQDRQDTVVDARNDLADASTNTSLVTKVCDVCASLADDDACFLRGDDGSQGDLSLSIFIFGAGRNVISGGAEATHLIRDGINSIVLDSGCGGELLVSRHGDD